MHIFAIFRFQPWDPFPLNLLRHKKHCDEFSKSPDDEVGDDGDEADDGDEDGDNSDDNDDEGCKGWGDDGFYI